LNACQDLHSLYRRVIKIAPEDWERIEIQIGELERDMAALLATYQD
jgi:hypothetical protein